MRDICLTCRYHKPHTIEAGYCVKYGCDVEYGKVYCISWQKEERLRYIIQKGNEFLVAIAYTDTKLPRYSMSPWDAAPIERKEDAERVAEKVGGDVKVFNPVSGVMV